MMPQIRILHAGPDADRLLELLAEAGLELAADADGTKAPEPIEEGTTDVVPDEDEDGAIDVDGDEDGDAAPDADGLPDAEETVCVIVVGDELDASVEAAVRQAAERGGRVIGIWQPSQETDELPRVLDEYGSGCVPWDARKLGDVVRGEGEGWQDPSGDARAPVPTKRNRC